MKEMRKNQLKALNNLISTNLLLEESSFKDKFWMFIRDDEQKEPLDIVEMLEFVMLTLEEKF